MNAIVTYWQGISQREQMMFGVVAGVIVLLIFYLGIIGPISSSYEAAQKDLKIESNLNAWVSSKTRELKGLRAASGGRGAGNASIPLNQAVTNSVKRYGLEIERLQPQQDDIQVWLKPMPFNNLIRWLEDLDKNFSVSVKFLEIGNTDAAGVVEIKRLQLSRG